LKEKVGYRRLYDAIGVMGGDAGEIHLEFDIGSNPCEIYLGTRPHYGVWDIERGAKYMVLDQMVELLKGAYNPDPSQTRYAGHFFVEIVVWKWVDVADEISKAFHEMDSAAGDKLTKMAMQHGSELRAYLDLIAGVLGLRFHFQLVLCVFRAKTGTHSERKWALIPTQSGH